MQREAALALTAAALAGNPGKMTREVWNKLAGIAGSALEKYWKLTEDLIFRVFVSVI